MKAPPRQPILIDEHTVGIPLTQGAVSLIDARDLALVGGNRWCLLKCKDGQVYAGRCEGGRANKQMVLMHRVILGAGPGEHVDHEDRNGLNNRRSNLRRCSPSQNQCNRKRQAGATSKYRGVSWNTAREHWVAQIKFSGRHKFLGRFASEEAAARAYDAAAVEMHGEFAQLNFSDGKPTKSLIEVDDRFVK